MWLKSKSGESRESLLHLGELESALMEFMWHRGEANVAETQAEFAPNLAYSTVMTTMCRLWKKGLLKRRKVYKSYVYVAALTERQYHDKLTHHLLGLALNRGWNTGAVLSHFVDAVGVDKETLERLEQLIKNKRRTLRLTSNMKARK